MVLTFINLRIFSAKYKVMCTTVCSYTRGLISIFLHNAINTCKLPGTIKWEASPFHPLLFFSILQIVLQSIFFPSFAAFSPFHFLSDRQLSEKQEWMEHKQSSDNVKCICLSFYNFETFTFISSPTEALSTVCRPRFRLGENRKQQPLVSSLSTSKPIAPKSSYTVLEPTRTPGYLDTQLKVRVQLLYLQ